MIHKIEYPEILPILKQVLVSYQSADVDWHESASAAYAALIKC